MVHSEIHGFNVYVRICTLLLEKSSHVAWNCLISSQVPKQVKATN